MGGPDSLAHRGRSAIFDCLDVQADLDLDIWTPHEQPSVAAIHRTFVASLSLTKNTGTQELGQICLSFGRSKAKKLSASGGFNSLAP